MKDHREDADKPKLLSAFCAPGACVGLFTHTLPLISTAPEDGRNYYSPTEERQKPKLQKANCTSKSLGEEVADLGLRVT